MLQQKQQTLPYIGIFKLKSSEEFIGKVIEESATTYTISKPLCMVSTQQGLQFAPLVMMADLDEPVIIPKPVITATPNSQIQTQYETATSGIVLPQKSSIIS